MPIVATIRMSRGAFRKRRMMTNSISEPRANDAMIEMKSRVPEPPVPQADQGDQQAGRNDPEVRLSEVDDAIGLVDQGQPERDERRQRADDHAVGDRARRHVPVPEHDRDEVAQRGDHRDDGDEADRVVVEIPDSTSDR